MILLQITIPLAGRTTAYHNQTAQSINMSSAKDIAWRA
jgi:hypothetical protein